MSNKTEQSGDDAPIAGRADLVGVFENGCKPREQWRIGTEHEKFPFRRSDRTAPAYDAPDGIAALLTGFQRFGWQPVDEGGHTIALAGADGAISLEPAGQFELSGAPLADVHAAAAEIARHFDQCRAVGAELGLGFLLLGFDPVRRRDELPIMPKGRYRIMIDHMPRVGRLGLDMMLRTSTVQTNLDYASEADMVRKFRVGLALQPLATALFANSPFTEGRPNGYLSYRSQIWTETDPARTGMLPFVFEDGFGFERYVDYALDVPMYFVVRDGRYIDAAGLSFRDFLDGRLPALPGEIATLGDWKDHLSTAFPEVRMKNYLEMRGADAGPQGHLAALPALWAGLLYDEHALDCALDLIRGWTAADHARLRAEVPRLGLRTATPGGGTLGTLAREALAIAAAGLDARQRLDGEGRTEAVHLEPLLAIAQSGVTRAERLLEAFHGRWGGRIDPIWDEAAL